MLAVIVIVVLLVIVVGAMSWRIIRGNEEMVPGGSMGDQILAGKNKRDPSKRRNRGKQPK